MTTLQINDTEAESVVAMYGHDTIIEYIKTFKPKSRSSYSSNDLDAKLKSLKFKNPKNGDKLQKAFSSLNKKLGNFKDIDLDEAKKEYFNKKYAIGV